LTTDVVIVGGGLAGRRLRANPWRGRRVTDAAFTSSVPAEPPTPSGSLVEAGHDLRSHGGVGPRWRRGRTAPYLDFTAGNDAAAD